MKILVYSTKDFEIPFLEKANNELHQIKYVPDRLTVRTVTLTVGFDVISIFSADDASPIVLETLKDFGIQYITLRSAGHDNVNLYKAKQLGIKVANAPGYSPNAIAEHAVTLLQVLNRKILLAHQQVMAYNFSLSNLVGVDLNQKTVGIIGTGNIGSVLTKIMHGFACNILAYDIEENKNLAEAYAVTYVGLEMLYKKADIIMISVPLNTETHHLINTHALQLMKPNVLLINIARGAVVDTKAVITALQQKQIAGYGADVYEYESEVFFYDRSTNQPNDTMLQDLLALPNVLLTPHQAFATQEALTNIAETTFDTINSWQNKETVIHELTLELGRY